MKILLSFILALGLASDSFASGDAEVGRGSYIAALLQSAKVSGMCGVFHQMGRFQDVTKMPGGDEFIFRFLNTETARLGVTLEEFFYNCDVSTQAYKDGIETARKSGL